MAIAKILIVEDELLIAKMLARKLAKMDYEVVDIVSSGEMAVKRAAESLPDLILMDIVIKGEIDGIETAAIIGKNLDIPIIYTTAYADDKTLQRAEGTGCYGYVIKPFKERDLHATIKMALNKHKEAQKIRESLAAAEALGEDKSRYLSMASHDLRAPLTAIQMSADMLRRYDQKWDEEKKSKHFQRIQQAVTNMNQMLEDVLTLSKAQSGKIAFNPAPVDILEFCSHLAEEVKPLASDRHRLTFSSHGDCQPAHVDEKLLRYLLTNLLGNAIKYSPNGGTVSFDVTCSDRAVTFRIADEGIGIPPEYQAKLFQQFERAANVGEIKGTGLGLCIVKQAVDLHGGEIAVESQVGVGTTFTVTLPRAA